MIELPALLLFPLLGALAGLLAGMFGIGGGLVIVPALNLLFAQMGVSPSRQMHLALATSLGTIFFTSLTSVWAHHRRDAVLWPTVRRLVPGILAGAFAGAWLAEALPNEVLRRIFGVFAVLVCLYLVLEVSPRPRGARPGALGHAVAGGLIGTLAAITGIGGGAISNPFLLAYGVDVRRSVATSAACTFPVAAASTAGYVWSGWGVTGLPAGSTGFVYWPAVAGILAGSLLMAPVGARIAHSIPTGWLKRAFAVLLILIGLRMALF